MKLVPNLQPWWTARAPRERRALLAAAWIVALGLLWSLAIAPAVRTLREAPRQQARWAPQWAQMRSLAAEAQALQAQHTTPLQRSDSERALQAATQRHLGPTAQVRLLGDRANITLQGASASALAEWLEEVRLNARLTPSEARLTQASTDPKAASGTHWNGAIVLSGAGLATP